MIKKNIYLLKVFFPTNKQKKQIRIIKNLYNYKIGKLFKNEKFEIIKYSLINKKKESP